MPVYKLVILYDGTNYQGWQVQKKGRTIQGELINALGRFDLGKFRLIGASRTDAGVHAEGQVASLHVERELKYSLEEFRRALNNILPEDIAITEISKETESFNARFSAKGKIYRYQFCFEKDPFFGRYCWQVRKFDIEKFKTFLEILKGKWNFSHLLIGYKEEKPSPYVELFWTSWETEGDKEIFKVRIAGNRFFYKLVRILIGTMYYYVIKNREREEFLQFLKGQNMDSSLHIAPAKGLILEKVLY